VKSQPQSTNWHDFERVANRATEESDSRNNNSTVQNAREEHFVDAAVAAAFLSITRKYLLKLSRLQIVPAHPIGVGSRKQWRYLVSELRDWMLSSGAHSGLGQSPARPDNSSGSPRAPRGRR
jgi:hypothetical protein